MPKSKLAAGQVLQQGAELISPGGTYRAVFQRDGNFCVYDVAGHRFKWGSIQAGSHWHGQRLEMQSDGNCVIVDAAGAVVWATETSGNSGADLEIDDEGVLTVVTSSGQRIWSTADTPLYHIPHTHPNVRMDNYLESGKSLERGDQIVSPQHIFTATFQDDGNFCVRRAETNRFKWGSIQAGSDWGAARIDMRADGNCVISNADGAQIWETATAGTPGARLRLDDEGTLAVVSTSGAVLWSSEKDDRVYFVETMGREGTLTFPEHLGAKPRTANLTLYGLTKADVASYELTDGTWNALVFTAGLKGFSDTYLDLVAPTIKLSFAGGTYGVVGLISSATHIDSDHFLRSMMAVVLGCPMAGSGQSLPEDTLLESRFATIVFDREAKAKGTGEGYSYGWWMLPRTRYSPTFQALHLLLDHMKDELALYRFPNSTDKPLPSDDFKLASYDYPAIVTRMKDDFKNVSQWDLIPELTALLLSRALRMFPSEVFGISSGGHGSPVGIMNGILSHYEDIEKCMSWVVALRKKPVDVFDFATNCNVASLQNVNAMAKHSTYIIASDLTRNTPNPSIGMYQLGSTYHTCFSDSKKALEDILKDMMLLLAKGWNTPEAKTFYDALAADKTAEWKQQLVLFKSSAFAKIVAEVGCDVSKLVDAAKQHPDVGYSEASWRQADVKSLIPKAFPAYSGFAKDWSELALYSVDNRRTLTWNTDLPHGMLIRVFS